MCKKTLLGRGVFLLSLFRGRIGPGIVYSMEILCLRDIPGAKSSKNPVKARPVGEVVENLWILIGISRTSPGGIGGLDTGRARDRLKVGHFLRHKPAGPEGSDLLIC